ncbi:MAG: hypothetical protein GY778_22410 [bacterium]|nr:hypothetical protein [bacterium]
MHWTSRRRRLTALAVLGAVVVGVAIGLIIIATVAFGFESGIVLGGATWAICWLALTVWIWRETPAERVRRLNALTGGALPCPTCGYNLTGLQQARCPECGTQYTLDELYAAMGPPQVELEKR